MKILVNMKLGNGPLEYHIRPITQLEGVEEIFIVRDYPGPDLPKVTYHCPPRRISKLAIFATVYKLFTLIYLSLFRKPDLVHAYLLFPHGVLAYMSAKLTGRPVGISLLAGPVELHAIGSPLGVKFTDPLPWFGKVFVNILKNCNVVTTTGSYTRDFLTSKGISQNRIHVLPHSVSELMFHPTDTPKDYDIISVGRLAQVKHVEVVLRAISIISERYKKVKASIVGDGPCRTYLEKLVVELGISDNVEFSGFRKNVADYYNAGRVFVLTSEREGFPFSFVEAMRCGIPSVVSNCGDIIDIARDGLNAIVIQNYDDIEGFADAILRLLEDKELHHRLSRNALETVKELSVESIAREWGKLLKNLTGDVNYHE